MNQNGEKQWCVLVRSEWNDPAFRLERNGFEARDNIDVHESQKKIKQQLIQGEIVKIYSSWVISLISF